jgi:hypothetical protein
MPRFLYDLFNGPIWRAFLLMGLFGASPELVLYGYLSVAFYILFKGCLYGVLGHFMKH